MWFMSFDFVYNKGLSRRHIETAEEFIATARTALEHGLLVAFVDNLFSAAELLAKAVLLCEFSDADFRRKATHKAIQSRFNRFAHLGNVHPEYVETFNKLANLRYPTRYLESSLSLSRVEGQAMLTSLEGMLESTRRLVTHESNPKNPQRK